MEVVCGCVGSVQRRQYGDDPFRGIYHCSVLLSLGSQGLGCGVMNLPFYKREDARRLLTEFVENSVETIDADNKCPNCKEEFGYCESSSG